MSLSWEFVPQKMFIESLLCSRPWNSYILVSHVILRNTLLAGFLTSFLHWEKRFREAAVISEKQRAFDSVQPGSNPDSCVDQAVIYIYDGGF